LIYRDSAITLSMNSIFDYAISFSLSPFAIFSCRQIIRQPFVFSFIAPLHFAAEEPYADIFIIYAFFRLTLSAAFLLAFDYIATWLMPGY